MDACTSSAGRPHNLFQPAKTQNSTPRGAASARSCAASYMLCAIGHHGAQGGRLAKKTRPGTDRAEADQRINSLQHFFSSRAPTIHLIEVDHPRFVAHLRRLMVVAPDCGESHLGVGGAHGDAERRGRSLPVRGRVGVAHHQALALQDDRLRVVLSSRHLREQNPAERQQERLRHGCVEGSDRLLPRAEQVSQSRHWLRRHARV